MSGYFLLKYIDNEYFLCYNIIIRYREGYTLRIKLSQLFLACNIWTPDSVLKILDKNLSEIYVGDLSTVYAKFMLYPVIAFGTDYIIIDF